MTMEEKVAKALFDHNQSMCNISPEEWKYVGVKGYWFNLARAAIEAMREPTETMDNAGEQWCDQTSAMVVWQAMIDAALNEKA